jgi:hypothetical protein
MFTVLGRVFSPELLAEIVQRAVNSSRTALAKIVCERLHWLDPRGRFQLMSARKALRELERRQLLQLPASLFSWPARKAIQGLAAPAQPIECSLAELGQVELILVGGRRSKTAYLWRQAIQHHPLGQHSLCGAQLRYVIQSSKGCLGALAFSAPALKLKARDEAIGWSQEVRRHRLQEIVNNSRYLLLPWVQVPHLASHVLALAAKLLPGHWQERYGLRPLLLESFTDRAQYSGTCYKAAGWQLVGQTSGRGRQDSEHEHHSSIRDIWIKPLDPEWKEKLQNPPLQPRLRPLPARAPAALDSLLPPPTDWAQEEMRAAALPDKRLKDRLMTLARDFFARPAAHIPEACGSKAKTKAAYRFFDHPQVTLDAILASHRQQTLQRMHAHAIVLAVHDTTELDYTAHPATEGLGPIGNHREHVQGLHLHPTIAFSTQGVPLGILSGQHWVRQPGHRINFRQPIEAKESFKWLQGFAAAEEAQRLCPSTMVVSLGDAEADVYELFAKAANSPAKLLVRAYRQRQLENNLGSLWTYISSLPVAGKTVFDLPRRGALKARAVELSVRFSAVRIQAPGYLKDSPSVSLWAIMLREEGTPPQGTHAVEWLLLTNIAVNTFEEAVQKARWYMNRFQIEVYFRTLKTGCRIEDRQLGTVQRLENCLAIDMVVAWRIAYLKMQSRLTPEAPCTEHFDEAECQVLQLLCAPAQKGAPTLPITLPSLHQSIRRVAMLGGFLGRKADGEPGAQTLWRGLQRLQDIAIGFVLAQNQMTPPVPSFLDSG